MIRFLLVIPLTFFFGMALAQQDPQFSQYMFNNMSINPGFAGSKDAVNVTLFNRNQWLGFPGAPTTSLFTASVPLKPFNISSGLGLTASTDAIGFQTTNNVSVSYSYIATVRNGDAKLGIGISIGFLTSAFNPKYITYNGEQLPITVPGETSSDNAKTYDIGLGGYYHSENLYLGVSTTHLTQSTYHYLLGANLSLTRNYYITTGYNLALQNPAFEYQPSAIVRFDGTSSSVDLSSLILYNKKFWGGLSYRWNAAIVLILGMELPNGLRIGYSYDYTLNGLNASTHEIMLSYNFSLVKEKILHKYRSVRFL